LRRTRLARVRQERTAINLPSIMTWSNACGFCLLGLAMLWLPALAPGLIAPNPFFGTSTRELWLQFMGTFNASLGAGTLGWHAMKQAWRLPVWLEPPMPQPELMPVALPQPVRAA
jgi:hypothetical protein